MPEAVAVRKADIDSLKGYLSRTSDRVRLPYQRRAADFPRQSVFCSTTNRAQYLADDSGARRFWCVKGLVHFSHVRREELAEARPQIWAEAVAAFRGGEPWYLDDTTEGGAASAASARYVADPWEQRLGQWIREAKPSAPTILDAWHVVAVNARGDLAGLDNAKAARLRAAMGRLGWECAGSGVFFQGF
jgi:predicted P-loop ATPase